MTLTQTHEYGSPLRLLFPFINLQLTEHDALRLLHELQVHQIELEMQNEELRHVNAELSESITG